MTNGAINSLSYSVRTRVVFKYFGQFCIVAAVLTSISLLVSLLCGEFAISLRYALIIITLSVAGALLSRLETPCGVQINEALVLTALIFVMMPLLLTFAMMGAGLGFIDALFEAVSGITTTGLSTLATVEGKPLSFLFSRAWLQWSGGLGIVVLSVALILGPGLTARRLVDFDVSDDLIGSTKIYARRILLFYSLLTVAGFLLILSTGVAPFTALVHTLAAVSTGGFSSFDQSLAAFDGWAPAFAIIAVSALGAIPLGLYYKTYQKGFRTLIKDIQFQTLVILSLFIFLLLLFLMSGGFAFTVETVNNAFLMAFSAQTTAGFSTLSVVDLEPGAKLVMIIAMLIGGGIGSTAGGIKILRLLILFRLIGLTLIGTSLAPHAVLEPRIGGHRLDQKEIDRALMIIILFGLVVLISWMPFVIMGFSPLDSLFEVVSATGTVGLSTGITSPGLPALLKIVLCVDMLMGRLEIVAFLILFYPKTWLGRRM